MILQGIDRVNDGGAEETGSDNRHPSFPITATSIGRHIRIHYFDIVEKKVLVWSRLHHLRDHPHGPSSWEQSASQSTDEKAPFCCRRYWVRGF